MLGRRQVAEWNRFGRRGEKVVGRPQGEGKAVKIGFRGWQSVALTADYINLRGYEALYVEDERGLESKTPLLAKNARNGAPRFNYPPHLGDPPVFVT